ncbi:MAG: HD domain-containing protein [Bacillota bacterium]
MQSFYAKIDSYNMTTYDTNTLSVFDADGHRHTIRIDEHADVKEGEVYRFDVETIEFKAKEQYLVKTYAHVSEIDLSLKEKESLMAKFYDFAPASIESIEKTVEAYISKMDEGPVKAITLDLFRKYEEDFYLYPAATRFHHAYIGGVAHHTATMLKLSDGIVETYPYMNHSLLIAGILLHDLFKTVELSNYHAPEYTVEGRMIGHISMGHDMIGESARRLGHYDNEARMLLQHMVLSHHYYGNFGSPKKPNLPEALALHFIDNIDSKFAVLGEALKETKTGEFTQSIGVLDRERFYKSKYTKE